jgi:hypothetical protein
VEIAQPHRPHRHLRRFPDDRAGQGHALRPRGGTAGRSGTTRLAGDAAIPGRRRHPQLVSRDWIAKLDSFLKLSDRDLLAHAGTISHDQALAKAQSEFDKFRAIEDAKPRAVDVHFEKAIEQAKQIAAAKPKGKPKTSP